MSDVVMASIRIMQASRYLAMAAVHASRDDGYRGWEYEAAMHEFEGTASALGFALVKVEAVAAPETPDTEITGAAA